MRVTEVGVSSQRHFRDPGESGSVLAVGVELSATVEDGEDFHQVVAQLAEQAEARVEDLKRKKLDAIRRATCVAQARDLLGTYRTGMAQAQEAIDGLLARYPEVAEAPPGVVNETPAPAIETMRSPMPERPGRPPRGCGRRTTRSAFVPMPVHAPGDR